MGKLIETNSVEQGMKPVNADTGKRKYYYKFFVYTGGKGKGRTLVGSFWELHIARKVAEKCGKRGCSIKKQRVYEDDLTVK